MTIGRSVTAEVGGRVPSSPPFIPKELGKFWKIGAIHKKIHTKRHPPTLPVVAAPAESFHHFALRSPLLAADCVSVDIHGDVAVGVAHQRLNRLHIGRKQVIFVHPLWDCNRPTELLAEAVADADQNGDIRFLDTLNIVRRPSFAYQALS